MSDASTRACSASVASARRLDDRPTDSGSAGASARAPGRELCVAPRPDAARTSAAGAWAPAGGAGARQRTANRANRRFMGFSPRGGVQGIQSRAPHPIIISRRARTRQAGRVRAGDEASPAVRDGRGSARRRRRSDGFTCSSASTAVATKAPPACLGLARRLPRRRRSVRDGGWFRAAGPPAGGESGAGGLGAGPAPAGIQADGGRLAPSIRGEEKMVLKRLTVVGIALLTGLAAAPAAGQDTEPVAGSESGRLGDGVRRAGDVARRAHPAVDRRCRVRLCDAPAGRRQDVPVQPAGRRRGDAGARPRHRRDPLALELPGPVPDDARDPQPRAGTQGRPPPTPTDASSRSASAAS